MLKLWSIQTALMKMFLFLVYVANTHKNSHIVKDGALYLVDTDSQGIWQLLTVM